MLQGDLADDQTAEKLQVKVDSCTSRLAGLDAALAALRVQIADIEQKLADERAAVERAKAAEKLENDLDGSSARCRIIWRRLAGSLMFWSWSFSITKARKWRGSSATEWRRSRSPALVPYRSCAAWLPRSVMAPRQSLRQSLRPILSR
jgi:hypothetical protein